MTDHRKTAVYIRLSAEDDNVDGRAKKESDSVTSQRILLKSFVIDQLGVAEADILEYVDDGVSGTHFKRQGFQQLQDDMKSGEIGCVVVKDFSRFGRDYLEVGFYIEYIFPLLQIRFISINDSYDSAASSGMTGGMNVALQNLVYNMYSLDLSKKISSALQTRTRNGTRLPVNARYGYKKGKDGRLEVDPEAAKVVKMIFQMAAEGTSFADITRELNRQAIATCDEQKLSRGDQVQFQRFDTIKKKHWSPTTVAAIVRDEIYIGTRIWGKTRCSMHTGHKAVLNDETEWVRLENHHTAIIDRELFEKANEMHPKKKRSVAESRTNFTLERRKKQPALLICANCGHSLLKETEHLLKCSDARTNGDPVCRSLVIRREPLEENILGLVHQYAASMLEKEKKVSSNRQCDYKEINTAELQKQSRQLTSEKMKLYDDYKDGRIDRDSYKQRAEKISVQLDEIKRKIEDAKNSKKLLEQNELSDKIKLKDFLGIQKFDTEKLREIIKVIRVHSQDEIEIDLLELLRVLWSKIGYVILAALALGLLMVLVSKVFMKPQYESTTKMYVLSKQDSSSTVTSGDLQASSLLTKDYAELIQSRQVVETVIAQLNLDLTYEEFLNKITVTTQNDTRILSITVKDEDPYVASQMADAIRVAASDHIQNVMNTEAVNVVDEANIPDEPVSPSIKKNGLIGAIAGAFIAIVIIIIVYLTNDTIQTSEDVERYLGVSTLGIIPLAEGQKKSKKKNKNGRGRKK
mgnify:CR=1 FL=1